VKAVSGPLDKALHKEMRAAIVEGIQRALLDNENGAKFAEAITKGLNTKIEQIVQKELSSTIQSTLDKSVVPLLSKLEERIQSSFEKSAQRILKESRASQQDLAKKLDTLANGISKLETQLQASAVASTEKVKADESVPEAERQEEQVKKYLRDGNFPAAIEIVSTHSKFF
jgi:CRISPR/Cas system Type II protein with McrA/HNH and RuvC-like nuclease domain